MNKTIEKFLRDNKNKYGLIGSEYTLRIQNENKDTGDIEFYIRPSDRDGETYDFIVKGNDIHMVTKH